MGEELRSFLELDTPGSIRTLTNVKDAPRRPVNADSGASQLLSSPNYRLECGILYRDITAKDAAPCAGDSRAAEPSAWRTSAPGNLSELV
ncbi:hypothetical protein KM043_010251 [Ampulex compressa]|nr:hypothetical protein KM043_010251 [Ampulex compressa]